MSRLPVCSGADAVKVFRQFKGTLRALIREAGLSKEQFTDLLH
jgi:hypothetical protein